MSFSDGMNGKNCAGNTILIEFSAILWYNLNLVMQISRIFLHNFRNYERCTFEFESGINVIVGPNGIGKTNLLEGIAYLSMARSFRGVKDSELVRWGQRGFDLKGVVESSFTNHLLEVHYHDGRKNFLIDGKKVDTFGDIFKFFVALVVTARDQGIVDGPPEERRRNLDYFGSYYDPAYYQLLMDYRKALKEKNALLKKNPPIEHVIPWNLKLLEIGEEIVSARERLLRMIENILNLKIRDLGLEGTVEFIYEPSIEGLKNYTKDLYEEERRVGHSLSGPHRDRITLSYMGYPVNVSASEGQKRLILLGLILTEREILGDRMGEVPVLILDEPMSVLGEDKISMVISSLNGQVFISSVRHIPGFRAIEPGLVRQGIYGKN